LVGKRKGEDLGIDGKLILNWP